MTPIWRVLSRQIASAGGRGPGTRYTRPWAKLRRPFGGPPKAFEVDHDDVANRGPSGPGKSMKTCKVGFNVDSPAKTAKGLRKAGLKVGVEVGDGLRLMSGRSEVGRCGCLARPWHRFPVLRFDSYDRSLRPPPLRLRKASSPCGSRPQSRETRARQTANLAETEAFGAFHGSEPTDLCRPANRDGLRWARMSCGPCHNMASLQCIS